MCAPDSRGKSKLWQTFSEYAQKASPNFQTRERPQTWALMSPIGKQDGGCQQDVWQDKEKAYQLKNSSLMREQEAWIGCIKRRSEKASESLAALTEGISLPKVDSKHRRMCLQMQIQNYKSSRNIKSQRNIKPSSKYHYNFTVTNPKDIKICNLAKKNSK